MIAMRLIVKRLIWMVPLLVGMSAVSFVMIHVAPGDPASVMFDPNFSVKDQALVRKNLGLDQPLVVQYGHWLAHMVRGDFGYSYVTGKPVVTSFLERLPATLLLSVSSLVLIVGITLPLGMYSGAHPGSWIDRLIANITLLGLSVPTFWLGMMMIMVFSVWLGWFPSSGYLNPDLSEAGFLGTFLDRLHHLILPLFTIVIASLAGLTRYHRSGTKQLLNEPFVIACRARGLSENRILFKHILKNAALPLITILGLELPALMSGAFVVEYLFAWPGMGQLGIASIFSRDYPMIMGLLWVGAILLIFGNMLADMAYAWVDPRIR